MTLPLLGVAVTLPDWATVKDWICEPGRTIEIQDFCGIGVLEGDTDDLVARWTAELADHHGARGIHGPFFGLDLSTPDREVRAVVQKRFLQALEIAEALSATHMVVHSPYTYWHVLNRGNYPGIGPSLIEAAAECLAPVLDRAAGIGCTLTLENIDDTDPMDRVRMVQQIGHANLRVSLDTGHAHLAHGRYTAPPAVDFVAPAAGLLGHVHLQDADGYADRHWHPGDGTIPWRPMFDALAACDPAPRLILEVARDFARLPATVAALEARGLGR